MPVCAALSQQALSKEPLIWEWWEIHVGGIAGTCRLVQWLQRYSHADAPHHLRLAAAGCLLQLSASTGNAVQTAVAAVASERSPALRCILTSTV